MDRGDSINRFDKAQWLVESYLFDRLEKDKRVR